MTSSSSIYDLNQRKTSIDINHRIQPRILLSAFQEASIEKLGATPIGLVNCE